MLAVKQGEPTALLPDLEDLPLLKQHLSVSRPRFTFSGLRALGQSATADALLTVGGRVTLRSALGQSTTAAALLTVGGRIAVGATAAEPHAQGEQRLLSALGQRAFAATLLTVGGRMTWQSALGQSAITAALLTVGGRMTWRSALGQSATAATLLTVGGHMTWRSALGHGATGAALLTVGGRIALGAAGGRDGAPPVRQSALGQSATAAAILTVGGRVTWQSALGQSATAVVLLTVGGSVTWQSTATQSHARDLAGDLGLGVREGLGRRVAIAAAEPHAQGEQRLLSALGTLLTVGGRMTWRSALGHGATTTALLTVGGRIALGAAGGRDGAPPVRDVRPLVRATRLDRRIRCRVAWLRCVEGSACAHHEQLHVMTRVVEDRLLPSAGEAHADFEGCCFAQVPATLLAACLRVRFGA